MNRKKAIKKPSEHKVYKELKGLHTSLGKAFKLQFNRSLPFPDELFDRWERAKSLGFGKGSNIYDSSYVIGDVKVGENTWIGMFTILDGSGGLTIGSYCTISAGVHIYTHDNINQTLTSHKAGIKREPVKIGDATYIGPNCIITKGITIGKQCIIGTQSFVNQDIPDNSVAVGSPVKIIGRTIVKGKELKIEYLKKAHS